MGLFENRLQLESTVVFLKCFIIIFPYFPRTWPENWGHKPWTTEWTSGHTSSDEKLGTWQITFSGGKMLATKDLWKAPNIEIGRENIGFFLVTFLRSPESGYVFGEICEVVKSKDWSLIEKKLKSLHPHQKQSGHRKNYSSTVDHHGILIVGGWGASCTENLGQIQPNTTVVVWL